MGVNSWGMNRTVTYITGFLAIFFVMFFLCRALCAAEGKDDDAFDARKTKELFIGQAVKLFAKGYIAVTDIDKAKKTNIAKLEKMDDQEFRGRYTALYNDMKGLPQDVMSAYGIDEKMDRTMAIKKIREAGKKDLYTIIDSIPDAFIAKHFDNYFVEKGLDQNRAASLQEIIPFWNNIRKKLEGD